MSAASSAGPLGPGPLCGTVSSLLWGLHELMLWALSHQTAVVEAQAGRPTPKPLAWSPTISLTLAVVSSGTGPGRMWFLRPVLQAGEDLIIDGLLSLPGACFLLIELSSFVQSVFAEQLLGAQPCARCWG